MQTEPPSRKTVPPPVRSNNENIRQFDFYSRIVYYYFPFFCNRKLRPSDGELTSAKCDVRNSVHGIYMRVAAGGRFLWLKIRRLSARVRSSYNERRTESVWWGVHRTLEYNAVYYTAGRTRTKKKKKKKKNRSLFLPSRECLNTSGSFWGGNPLLFFFFLIADSPPPTLSHVFLSSDYIYTRHSCVRRAARTYVYLYIYTIR